MGIPFLSRRKKTEAPSPAKAMPIGKPPKRSRRRRLLRTILLVGLFAAFTNPGRRLVRGIARWADGHVEGFAEPESRIYSAFIAPLVGRLYRRAADDVAAQLKGFGKGKRPLIVDVGCGTGDLAVAISRKLRDSRIVGVDSSPSMLLYASRHETTDGRLRFMVGDGANMPFADGSVDLVVSTLSLHHWADPVSVLAEIDRVLRPGGHAFIYDLGLLAPTPQEMAGTIAASGIAADSITVEKVRGSLLSRLFVLFRYEPER